MQVCIFDADQLANSDFYIKTVPLFDLGDDVGMVLSPQAFHNLRLHADIFNHANIHFWEYSQPGYDALGFISCTGAPRFLDRLSSIGSFLAGCYCLSSAVCTCTSAGCDLGGGPTGSKRSWLHYGVADLLFACLQVQTSCAELQPCRRQAGRPLTP